MTLLLDLTLRSSVVLLVGLGAATALRQRAAALRHLVLTASVVAAVAMVPATFLMPGWHLPLPGPSRSASETLRVTTPVAAASEAAVGGGAAAPFVDVSEILFVLWAVGWVMAATLLVTGLGRLARLTSRARRVTDGAWPRVAAALAAEHGIRRPIALLATDARDVLATCGLFRPRVFLPVQALEWCEPRVRAVLTHEIAHIRRCDWFVQVSAEALRTVFWFNPLMWLVCAGLRRESEHACDDAVIGGGVPASEYASHLVEIALACRGRGTAAVAAVPIVHRSTLERRIAAMLNADMNRQKLTPRAIAITIVALAAVALPTAAFRVSAQEGPRALVGHVYDRSGAVLPEVSVTLIDEQQVKWPTTSDGTGRFEFAPVGPGRFVLEASLPGFRTLRNEFVLSAPKDWARAVTLQVGEVEETVTVTARRPTAARPATPAGTDEPVRVGGNIKPPLKLKDARPVYPVSMQEAGLEGVVPMEALIGADGTVVSVRVLSAQVHPEFARAAEDAVRQWRFSATLLNGAPVEVRMMVSVAFSLRD